MGYKRQAVGHRALEELATRQHGVVSTRQLAELGYSRSSAAKAARAGRLHRLHRGVYSVGHRRLAWEGRCLAAVLACSPTVASHTTAAWLWGLLTYRPTTFDLTAASGRHAKPSFRVHAARLLDEDIDVRDGIPVTSLVRTLLDLAANLPPRRLDRVLDRAEARRLLDLRRLDPLLLRCAGHRGRAPLREALRIYRPTARITRSELERRFLALVLAAGLPPPATNFNVGAYELDCYWASGRFGVELDVYATHGSPLAFERDRERADDLLALGVEITRVTDIRLEREPAAVLARVAAHLRRRGASTENLQSRD